ncbi:MAG: hypothetical protein HN348_14100 [Proteobacteria bacterium]|jgi:hypothetical protein|nr:hypothetical protein [Pseudomonadota bacterium]
MGQIGQAGACKEHYRCRCVEFGHISGKSILLRWTPAGAVPSPTALQIRVTRVFPGRVQAGAPFPSADLGAPEVLNNIEHFTQGMRGPRTQPCSALVLSGTLDESLASVLEQGRAWGINRITAHLALVDAIDWQKSKLAPLVDHIVVNLSSPSDAARLQGLNIAFSAAVLLDEITLPQLPQLARGLVAARPERIVFTWPFPPISPPPPTSAVAGPLGEALSLLDNKVDCGIKGLPACQLPDGPLRRGDRLWRSGNRWYVDADHQFSQAMLFFPHIVRFAKSDVCRFCSRDTTCDGVVEQWRDARLTSSLVPVEDRSSKVDK